MTDAAGPPGPLIGSGQAADVYALGETDSFGVQPSGPAFRLVELFQERFPVPSGTRPSLKLTRLAT